MKTKKYLGGKVIEAGGYGCIFKPPLLCKNKTLRSNGISKLLIKKEGQKEYNEFLEIQPILEKISNYKNYFLISEFELCSPNILDKNDLINFDKCKNLSKFNITEANINNNLDKLQIINLPYGGEDLDKLILESGSMNINEFILLNNKLINLLKNGIYPMNQLNLLHNDLKASNILYDKTDNQLRIIDWGFVTKLNSTIPSRFDNRVMQFNSPFSLILLNKQFNTFYKSKLNNLLEENITYFDIKNIALEYFYTNIYQSGHYRYLFDYIFPDLFYYIKYIIPQAHVNSVIKYTFGINIIINYLTDILYNFTNFKKQEFDKDKYFKEVYSKNTDIWGFITIYISFITAINKNKLIFESSKIKKYILQIIQNILIKYLYSTQYASKPIDQYELIKDLQKINNIINYVPKTIKQTIKKTTKKSPVQPIIFNLPFLKKASPKKSTTKKSIPKKLPRCPNGTRRNKKTGECEKK